MKVGEEMEVTQIQDSKVATQQLITINKTSRDKLPRSRLVKGPGILGYAIMGWFQLTSYFRTLSSRIQIRFNAILVSGSVIIEQDAFLAPFI